MQDILPMIYPVIRHFNNNNIKIIIPNQYENNSYIYIKYFINNVFGFNNEIIIVNDNIYIEELNLVYFGDICKPFHSIVPYFLRKKASRWLAFFLPILIRRVFGC